MSNTTMQKLGGAKNQRVQVLRGVAILAVVVIHSSMAPIAQLFVRPFVNFAVALFIFLSGYLTKTEIANVKAFASKRIMKVLVPYVLWTVIYAVPSGFDGFLNNLLTGRSCAAFYICVYPVGSTDSVDLPAVKVEIQLGWLGYYAGNHCSVPVCVQPDGDFRLKQ